MVLLKESLSSLIEPPRVSNSVLPEWTPSSCGVSLLHILHQSLANGDLSIQFGMKARTCQSCPVKRQCLAPHSKGVGGRRVNVIRRAISTAKGVVDTRSAIVRSAIQWLVNPQPKYEQPIYWCDLAATRMRRAWHEHLSRQEIEIKAIERPRQSKTKPDEVLLSRAQREHRQLSWWKRWERNARKAEDPRWAIVLYSGKAIAQGMQLLSQRSFHRAA